MCGIVGGTNPAWNYSGAVESMRRRGPDAQLVCRAGRLTLGFARLAIIDLSTAANQPMASDDEQVWLVFNGEIYGYRDLRSDLERRGHRFHSQSDTEVLLAAYLQWGDDFVDHIDGMFAVALYDRRIEQVKLFRDRPGIKPLYYFYDGEQFAFGSELKVLEALLGDDLPDVEPTAYYDFLTYRYVPAPKSLYQNIFKLEPASTLVYDIAQNRLHVPRRYWSLAPLDDSRHDVSFDEAKSEVRSLLEESVAQQLVADVPLGCFLSGGVDSSVVVAAGDASGQQLQTYSIGFEDQQCDETPFARMVAERFQTQHTERILDLTKVNAEFSQLRDWYGEPFADSSAFPTWLVSKVARESVTVALAGDGGDELFGGYSHYARFMRLRRLGAGRLGNWGGLFEPPQRYFRACSLPRRALNMAAYFGSNPLRLYTKLMGGLTKPEKAAYARELEIPSDYDDYWFFRQHWRGDLPARTRLQYLDFHTYLPEDILTKVDRVSMDNSLEVRVPLLSRKLIEFAFSLPEPIRYHGNQLKGLLKQVYVDELPREAIFREKSGFGLPWTSFDVDTTASLQEHILKKLYDVRPSRRVKQAA